MNSLNNVTDLPIDVITNVRNLIRYLADSRSRGIRGFAREELATVTFTGEPNDDSMLASRVSRIGKRLSLVEKTLGFELVSRSEGANATVANDARVQLFIDLVDRIESAFGDLGKCAKLVQPRRRVVIASFPSVVNQLGPIFVHCLVSQVKSSEIRFEMGMPHVLLQRLAAGLVDVALLTVTGLGEEYRNSVTMHELPNYRFPDIGVAFRYDPKSDGDPFAPLLEGLRSGLPVADLLEVMARLPMTAVRPSVGRTAHPFESFLWSRFFEEPQGIDAGPRIHVPNGRTAFLFAAHGTAITLKTYPAQSEIRAAGKTPAFLSRRNARLFVHPSQPRTTLCYLGPDVFGHGDRVVASGTSRAPATWGVPFAMYSRILSPGQDERPEIVELKKIISLICGGKVAAQTLANEFRCSDLIESLEFENGALRQETMA